MDRELPTPGPPRLARLLVWLATRRRDYEFVAGDLDELYRGVAQDEGIRRARTWYWAQARSMRRASGPVPPPPSSPGGASMLTTLGADVRSGARALMRTPGFTAVAVLMLALGIGVNTTIFSWLNAVLLAPLPGTSDTAELVELASLVDGQPDTVFSYPDYQVLRGLKNTSPLAAHSPRAVTLSFGGRPERAFAELVSDNLFTVLGTHAALGRTFLPEDVRGPGDAPVVVISDRLWHSRFGGDQNVVGRSLRLNDHQVTVVGVTAPEFQGAQPGLAMDVWLPITQHALVVPGAARPG